MLHYDYSGSLRHFLEHFDLRKDDILRSENFAELFSCCRYVLIANLLMDLPRRATHNFFNLLFSLLQFVLIDLDARLGLVL